MSHSSTCGCPQCDPSNRIEGMFYGDESLNKSNPARMQRDLDAARAEAYDPMVTKFDGRAYARNVAAGLK